MSILKNQALIAQLQRENKIALCEMEFDKLIAWFTDAPLNDPDFENKTLELHQLEVKMKRLMTVPAESTSHGIKEISTLNLFKR